MTQRLVIIGAGGFGREVLDVIEAINFDYATADTVPYEVLGFLDDGDPDPATLEPYGIAHLGPIDKLDSMDADIEYIIGIGSPQVRRAIDERFREDRTCPTLIHPTVTFNRAVTFGPGTVVCAGVRLTNNIEVGRHVHLNLNATVGHDARVDDFVTVSPGVAVSGYVHLGDEVMLGTGSVLNPGVRVGAGATLGSGAVALKDIAPGVVAVGVPAKPI